ncbi:hypothetical protein [Paraliobacillus sediminis]|uniref:hypothetical protein n=1 Tax=Paraliobacillus sediminis TaxID=1885916 RepID=UPI000E3C4BF6|nr:hypothetical protein [Paraliobacillus sediminis]
MKNIIKLIFAGMVIMFVPVGCNSDDGAEDSTEVSETTDEEVDNDASSEETKDLEEENTAEEESGNDGQGVLSLGETGQVESTIGDYEVTVESFQILDEFEDEKSLDEVFILVNFSLTNIGEEVIQGEDVYRAKIFNNGDIGYGNISDFESVEILKGEIGLGETVEGQFLFDQENSDYYELIVNYALSTVATELTWRFDADEKSG